MTWLAAIDEPSVVPRTRTAVPAVMALADVELAPSRYVVEAEPLTVTVVPVDVVSVKPDAETLLTVPADPPADGADRAFDPPPRGATCPAGAEGDAAVVEDDEA